MTDETTRELKAAHHALLFAEIAAAAVDAAGVEAGESAVRKAVRRYGEERGRRMALRAHADGAPLSLATFLEYGEWAPSPGEMTQTATETDGDVIVEVLKCPWHTAWETTGMINAGRLYCLEIDAALVRGFNPECEIRIASTRPNTGENCRFRFRNARRSRSAKGRKMPWAYHCGHLLRTMAETLAQELGSTGREAVAAGLAAFRRRAGDDATRCVQIASRLDFSRLPEHDAPQDIRNHRS